MENDKKQRDYTYIQREEEHKLDGNGQLKSSESRTYEIMVLYEEQVRKLIAKRRQAAQRKRCQKRRRENPEDHREAEERE